MCSIRRSTLSSPEWSNSAEPSKSSSLRRSPKASEVPKEDCEKRTCDDAVVAAFATTMGLAGSDSSSSAAARAGAAAAAEDPEDAAAAGSDSATGCDWPPVSTIWLPGSGGTRGGEASQNVALDGWPSPGLAWRLERITSKPSVEATQVASWLPSSAGLTTRTSLASPARLAFSTPRLLSAPGSQESANTTVAWLAPAAVGVCGW
mmetsp:Transcript_58153/g.138412  ORF Transcript_58153/g.138412 Transcript_58153/m.138412 type:complete len:205 (-) Transcript_58153:2210-2824(-)